MSVFRTIEALLVPTTATSQHRRDAIVPEGWQPPSFENAMSNSQEQSQIHPAAPATGTQLLKSTGGDTSGAAVDHVDALWKAISRFDLYVTSVNAKAALVATFNTFVITAIVLRWEEILMQFGPHLPAIRIAGLLLAVASIAAVVSLWFTFRALGPFLESHKAPGRYHSAFFFEHVAEHAHGADYRVAFEALNRDSLLADLCHQAHALACGASAKFKDMRRALRCIAFVQLPAMGALIALKLILLFVID
jgi:hypothetical protein